MLCQSVSSFHSLDWLSFQRRLAATLNFVTATPLGVKFVSASLPKWPSTITLFTLRVIQISFCVGGFNGALQGTRSVEGDRTTEPLHSLYNETTVKQI